MGRSNMYGMPIPAFRSPAGNCQLAQMPGGCPRGCAEEALQPHDTGPGDCHALPCCIYENIIQNWAVEDFHDILQGSKGGRRKGWPNYRRLQPAQLLRTNGQLGRYQKQCRNANLERGRRCSPDSGRLRRRGSHPVKSCRGQWQDSHPGVGWSALCRQLELLSAPSTNRSGSAES